MSQRNTKKFVFGLALTIGVVTTVVMLTGRLNAQAQAPFGQTSVAESNEPKAAFKVGTYDPQAAFQRHPLGEKLMEILQVIQPAIQQAQQEDDREKVMQLQQQFEQQRTQIIEQFQQDVQKALPKAAEAAGIKVIATEIAYTAEDVKTMDVTPLMVKLFTKEYEKQNEKESERPTIPQFPR